MDRKSQAWKSQDHILVSYEIQGFLKPVEIETHISLNPHLFFGNKSLKHQSMKLSSLSSGSVRALNCLAHTRRPASTKTAASTRSATRSVRSVGPLGLRVEVPVFEKRRPIPNIDAKMSLDSMKSGTLSPTQHFTRSLHLRSQIKRGPTRSV